jgi:CheY-like chemotaxis protein
VPQLPATRILIVDDHAYAATTLGRLLSSMGHVVEVVPDGAAALLKLEQFRPHLFLVDIAMPRMDGNELARQIRLREDLGDIALVALTGWDSRAARHRAVASDFDEYLLKPVNLDELEALLARFCAGRAAAVAGDALKVSPATA